MKLVIRPADLDKDQAVLVSTLRQHLTPLSDDRRFDWLYRRNPQGRARAWVAEDGPSGETIGASAAFPRRALVDGKERTGWVLGDFCIAEGYRSLGPALQLQKATLAAIDDLHETEFCYDFPSRQLTALYGRIGVRPSAHMVRLAKPLRVDEKCRRMIGMESLSRPATWIGNLLLRATDLTLGNTNGWEIGIQQEECSDEFTWLTQKKPSFNCIELQRSAAYLNWRYLQHPYVHHHILTARKAGELLGYLVFACHGQEVQISDWCAVEDNYRAVLTVLIGDLVCRLRNTGAMTLSAFLLHSDPRLSLFTQMGFWRRESSPLMVHWTGAQRPSTNDWLFMHGDRDI